MGGAYCKRYHSPGPYALNLRDNLAMTISLVFCKTSKSQMSFTVCPKTNDLNSWYICICSWYHTWIYFRLTLGTSGNPFTGSTRTKYHSRYSYYSTRITIVFKHFDIYSALNGIFTIEFDASIIKTRKRIIRISREFFGCFVELLVVYRFQADIREREREREREKNENKNYCKIQIKIKIFITFLRFKL